MSQFLLRNDHSPELEHFAHIHEFAQKKNNSINLSAFTDVCSNHLRIYFILEGKFDWVINEKLYTLYPHDLGVILPGHRLCAEKGYLDIGSLYWLHLQFPLPEKNNRRSPGGWSHISPQELISVRQMLFMGPTPVLSRVPEAGPIFTCLRNELFNQEIGYITRVNQLLDELLILLTRKFTQQENPQRDFPQTFLKLEETLRRDLSHHWTVEEMAALVGLGTTAFSDKVKKFTGFSPMNYLINIRISEAIRLLKKPDVQVTDIALDTGFYSSQHFATTFKKLTGHTPSQFRKNNI
ncbi:helix-turn-helix transcriptional regulator [Pseudoflavitalea rhizosphaerae]|uniref:helix-turn-helix transcriptional regulator n=1 Tax=Pseudoflavitalea rhizosphaerae TaxID=1884793 RepID=UPI000F8F2126|nr:AraC family transcriptional regulator [Pseudoflavitalea rhizosphaerae]